MDIQVVYAPAPGPAPAFSITRLPLQASSTLTSTPSFTVDLSAFGAGDRIFGVLGNGTTVNSANYNTSNAMSNVAGASSTGGVSGNRLGCFEYTLTGAGGASDTIDFVLAGSVNAHLFACFVVSGGSRVDQASDWKRGAQMSGSVSLTDSTNAIVAVAIGEDGTGGFTSWNIVTEDEEITGGADSRYIAIGTKLNATTGANNVQTTPVNATGGSTQDCVLSVIALEPT